MADITYIPTQVGWVYLAVLLDLFSLRIVGWAMDRQMTEALTIRALKMALSRRSPAPGIMHHSDQGSQYTSRAYQALLSEHGFVASMNGVGTWYGNVPISLNDLRSILLKKNSGTGVLFRYFIGA